MKILGVWAHQTPYEKLEKVIELLSQHNSIHLTSSDPTRLP